MAATASRRGVGIFLYSKIATKHAETMNRFLCLLLLSPSLCFAGDLTIENPWVRAVPPSSKATAAFMTIVNSSDHPISITGGSSPVAGEVKPMITTKKADGVMGMEFVESFPIPAKGRRVLEPGGDHIMMMQLREVPKAGDTIKLVLTTASGGKAGKISLEVPVR
jgi:hypothetical protein